MKTSIIVKNQKHGTHCWPDAPKEVEHLQAPHRHNFLFETKIEVSHDDRELEFFMVQDFIQSELDKLPKDLQKSSCEQLSKAVISMIHEKYGQRDVSCTVSEDGQNAAIVEYVIKPVIEGVRIYYNSLNCGYHRFLCLFIRIAAKSCFFSLCRSS